MNQPNQFGGSQTIPMSAGVDGYASTHMGTDPSDPLIGVILLGRYQVLQQLGVGGMGTVYLANHTTIRKKLAIKVLSREYCNKPDVVQRFLQEARAASMISQQNIVEITDYGDTPDGRAFFVMEFLDGEDLAHLVKREGALPWTRVAPIMKQICHALIAAHEAGIIHRYMKPENCYRITRGGSSDFVKVLDFGIAKVTTLGEEGKGLTKTGMIFGTPEYMSPEQAQGTKIDARVDVYALGVILFELLTGRVPYEGDNFMGILSKHLFEPVPRPNDVKPGLAIPADVEAIILKCMQKDRDYRFGSVAELLQALERVGTGAPPLAVVEGPIQARPGATPPPAVAATAAGYQAAAYGVPGPQAAFQPGYGQAHPGYGTPPPQPAVGYAGQPVGGMPGVPGYVAVAHSDERDRSVAKFAILAVLVLLGGGIGAFYVMQSKRQTPAPPAVAVAAPEPEGEPEPEPEPVHIEHVKHLNPETAKVKISITTNVPARIVDSIDDGIYGMTNEGDGVSVEQSDAPLTLVLRADGYEDVAFEVLPTRDKSFHKDLVKRPEKTRPRPRPKESEVSVYDLPEPSTTGTPAADPPSVNDPSPKLPTPPPTPEPEPEPEPEPAPAPGIGATKDATPAAPTTKKKKRGDLRNPFDD